MKMMRCRGLFVECCKLGWVPLHPACHLRTYQGDQLTSVFHGILEGIEATDQQRGDACIVVVKERFTHLLRCADQG
jgi:hypothetical protein